MDSLEKKPVPDSYIGLSESCNRMPGPWQACIALCIVLHALTGCGAHTRYLVDTGDANPLIESPYRHDDGFLRIPIPQVGLRCSTMTVRFMGHAIMFSTERGDQPSYFSPTRTVIAKIDTATARDLADKAARDGLESLRDALAGTGNSCGLTPACPDGACQPAAIAAEAVLRHLPRHYSAVLRDRYNHRVWMAKGAPQGVSFDLQAGMRLRIENSLPISPYGIGAMNAYPSSFAAPTYIYVHALTGTELCDNDTLTGVPSEREPCRQATSGGAARAAASDIEAERFLSLSSGMARWGTLQVDRAQVVMPFVSDPKEMLPLVERRQLQEAVRVAAPDARSLSLSIDRASVEAALAPPDTSVTGRVQDASGLIDLLEKSNVKPGARKHWRLWIPMSRKTLYTGSKPINQPNGGSIEASPPLPMLIAANSLGALNGLNYDTDLPCDPKSPSHSLPDPSEVTCYPLRYRVVPIPEVLVRVDHEERWVPVGSTLSDLVAHKLDSASAVVHFSRERDVRDEATTVHAARIASQDARRALAANLNVSRMFEGRRIEVLPTSLRNPVEVDRFLRLQIVAGDDIQWK